MREFPKFVVLQMLRGYKWAISPMLPAACRFVPTCSEYAAEAVERYGVVRGGWVALIRLLRCHPFSRGGYDPVVRRDLATNKPPQFSAKTREMGHPGFTGHPIQSATNDQRPTTPAHGAI
jgi:putative membrane protein insertion efficiency factor